MFQSEIYIYVYIYIGGRIYICIYSLQGTFVCSFDIRWESNWLFMYASNYKQISIFLFILSFIVFPWRIHCKFILYNIIRKKKYYLLHFNMFENKICHIWIYIFYCRYMVFYTINIYIHHGYFNNVRKILCLLSREERCIQTYEAFSLAKSFFLFFF